MQVAASCLDSPCRVSIGLSVYSLIHQWMRRRLACLCFFSSFLLPPFRLLPPSPLSPLPPPLCAENQSQGLPILGKHSTRSCVLSADVSYLGTAAQLQVSPLNGPGSCLYPVAAEMLFPGLLGMALWSFSFPKGSCIIKLPVWTDFLRHNHSLHKGRLCFCFYRHIFFYWGAKFEMYSPKNFKYMRAMFQAA